MLIFMNAFLRWGTLFVTTTLVFVLGFFHSLMRPRHPDNVYWTCQRLKSLPQAILGISFIGRGLERLEHNRPCIFISNHQNNFDMFPGSWCCPRRTVTLGKTSLLWVPIFGLFYAFSGNFFIDRKNKEKAYASLKEVARKIKDNNTSVWVMPEGTRSWGRGLLPFKKGAFYLAILAQVPVVPICFSSYHKKFNFKKRPPGKVIISVLPALSTVGKDTGQAVDLAQQARELMKNEIEKLDRELALS